MTITAEIARWVTAHFFRKKLFRSTGGTAAAAALPVILDDAGKLDDSFTADTLTPTTALTTATITGTTAVVTPVVKAAGAAGLRLEDDGDNLGVFVADGGNVGVGTGASEPDAKLHVVSAAGDSVKVDSTRTLDGSGILIPFRVVGTFTTSEDDDSVRNLYASATSAGTHDIATLASMYAQTYYGNTAGAMTHGWGGSLRFYKTGAGSTVSNVIGGAYVDYTIQAAGTVAQACGIFQSPGRVSDGTVEAAYGAKFYEPDVSGDGVVEDNYGLWVEGATVGTQSNIGLYVGYSSGTGIHNSGSLVNNGTAEIGGDLSVGGGISVLDGDMILVSSSSTGSELLTNGAFTSDTTGWTASAGSTLASVAGGQSGNALEVTGTGAAAAYAYQGFTTTAGMRYRVQFYFKSGTGQGTVRVGTSAGATDIYYEPFATVGDWTLKTVDFDATGTTTYVGLGIVGTTAGHTDLFDTVTIKELQGGNLTLNGKITSYTGTQGLSVNAGGVVTADFLMASLGGFRTAYVTLTDDEAVELRALYPIASGGLIILSTTTAANNAAIISYRASSSPFCTIVAQPSTVFATGTSALTTGAGDGTDAKINVASVSDGTLYVKNRMGYTIGLVITVLC